MALVYIFLIHHPQQNKNLIIFCNAQNIIKNELIIKKLFLIRFVFDKSVREIQGVRWSSDPPIRDFAVSHETVSPIVVARDIFVKFKEHHIILALSYSVGAEDVFVFSYPLGDFWVFREVSIDCDQQRELFKQCEKWYHWAVNYFVREQAFASLSDGVPMLLQALGQIG